MVVLLMKLFIEISLAIILLAGLVPLVIYVITGLITTGLRQKKTNKIYNYDKELFEYDMEDMKFENITSFQNRKHNRILVNSRGSVRQANGNILDNESFEQMKDEVYWIELP